MKYFSRFGIKVKYDSKYFQYATHTVDGKKNYFVVHGVFLSVRLYARAI